MAQTHGRRLLGPPHPVWGAKTPAGSPRVGPIPGPRDEVAGWRTVLLPGFSPGPRRTPGVFFQGPGARGAVRRHGRGRRFPGGGKLSRGRVPSTAYLERRLMGRKTGPGRALARTLTVVSACIPPSRSGSPTSYRRSARWWAGNPMIVAAGPGARAGPGGTVGDPRFQNALWGLAGPGLGSGRPGQRWSAARHGRLLAWPGRSPGPVPRGWTVQQLVDVRWPAGPRFAAGGRSGSEIFPSPRRPGPPDRAEPGRARPSANRGPGVASASFWEAARARGATRSHRAQLVTADRRGPGLFPLGGVVPLRPACGFQEAARVGAVGPRPRAGPTRGRFGRPPGPGRLGKNLFAGTPPFGRAEKHGVGPACGGPTLPRRSWPAIGPPATRPDRLSPTSSTYGRLESQVVFQAWTVSRGPTS